MQSAAALQSPVRFLSPDFAPHLPLFHCARHACDLSVSACAHNHVAARMFACSGCAVGRQHAVAAGLLSARAAPVRSALDAARCCRCMRSASRLVHGKLCVSCFNREREFIRGRNAKGTALQKLVLRTASALIAADDRLRPTGGFALEPLGGEYSFLEFHVVDCAEFDRTVAHLWPDVEVLDVDIGSYRHIDLLPASVRQPAPTLVPRAPHGGRERVRLL